MLGYELLVDLPYELDKLVTGYADKEKFEADQSAHLAYLGKSLKLLKVASDYRASYSRSSSPTLLEYRDLMISKAIMYSLQNMLFFDADRTLLTGHAEKAVQKYRTTLFYPFTDSNNTFTTPSRFGGLVGTVAYYFLYVKAEGFPLDYYNRLLSFIWGIHGANYSDVPKVRINSILTAMGFSPTFDRTVEVALKELFAITDSNHDFYSVLLYARRNALGPDDSINFTQKVLAGNYSEALIVVLAQILPPRVFDPIKIFVDNVLSMAKPVGFPLLIQALIVEAFVKAAMAITDLPQEIVNRGILGFFNDYDPANQPIRRSISQSLVTALDGFDYLIQNGIRKRLDYWADRIQLAYLIYSWLPPDVEARGPTRLDNLINTEPIGSDDSPPVGEDFFDYYQDAPPRGPEDIVIYRNRAIGHRVTFVVVNYSSPALPAINFITPDGTPPRVIVDQVDEGTVDPGDVPVIIDNPQQPIPKDPDGLIRVIRFGIRVSDPVVVIAVVDPDPNSPGSFETITPDRNNPDKEDTSVSTPVVLVPLPEEEEDLIEEGGELDPVISYQRFVYIPARVFPPWQFAPILPSGTTSSWLGTRQAVSRDKVDGAYIDYVGRMCALTKEISHVHGGEVEELEKWVGSLPLGRHARSKAAGLPNLRNFI